MLPQVLYLYPLNTQVITITELQDQQTGEFLIDANVTATLIDRRGIPDPVLRDITLAFVAGTDATYQGQVPDTFNAKLGGGYTLQITATQAGVQAFYSIPVIVQLRTNQ